MGDWLNSGQLSIGNCQEEDHIKLFHGISTSEVSQSKQTSIMYILANWIILPIRCFIILLNLPNRQWLVFLRIRRHCYSKYFTVISNREFDNELVFIYISLWTQSGRFSMWTVVSMLYEIIPRDDKRWWSSSVGRATAGHSMGVGLTHPDCIPAATNPVWGL